MLKVTLTFEDGKKAVFTRPLRLRLESAAEAPADILTVVLAAEGTVPPVGMAEVYDREECVFRGPADVQTEELSERGTLLTVTARSMASVLLDSEARPQVYCMPSMSLLMERHFIPLGFKEYTGDDLVFTGELNISKGMSEWSVLKTFCESAGAVPAVSRDGVIDITGGAASEIFISRSRVLSVKRRLERKALVSELYARTSIGGGYDMKLESSLADRHGVKRTRFINSVESSRRTVLTAEKLMKQADSGYETLIIDCGGRLLCAPGDRLTLEGMSGGFRVRELMYELGASGEHTVIRAGRESEENKNEII